MTNNKKAELISETTLRYAGYRFSEGIKQIISNPRKQMGVLVILALALLCHVLTKHIFTGNSIEGTLNVGVQLLNASITLIGLLCYVFVSWYTQSCISHT